MKYCVNCGKPLADHESICMGCGVQQPAGGPGPNPQPGGYPPNGDYRFYQPSGMGCGPYDRTNFPSATPYLIWSILLIFFCSPLGIVATVFSALATSARNIPEACHYIRVSKILCVVGTCLFAAFLLFYIAIILIAFLSASFALR